MPEEIKKDEIKIVKVISGFFFEQNLRYEELKFKFFDSVKELLNIKKLDLLQVANVDVLKNPGSPLFEFRMSDENYNYEDIFTSKEEFVKTSLELGKKWQDLSGKNFNKIGGVIHFIYSSRELSSINFILKYFNNFHTELQVKSTKFQFNYKEKINGTDYNVNLMLAGNDQQEKMIAGALDVNKSDEFQKAQDSEIILGDLFKYFETDFIKILNFKE